MLLLTAMTMMRLALRDDGLAALQSDAGNRRLIGWSLHLVPFAGIAFLWFIGVVREQLGDVEDRLFSTVFLGSGLLFLAMLFSGAAATNSILELRPARTPMPRCSTSAAAAPRRSSRSTRCGWPRSSRCR